MPMLPKILLSLTALGLAGSASAYDPIVTETGWTRVDSAEDGRCYGEVGTNGQFYVLAVYGMEPGETMRLTIGGGDMVPIRRSVRADGGGAWQDYYIPFRFNRQGGQIYATISGSTCQVPLSFTWKRKLGWDEPAPL